MPLSDGLDTRPCKILDPRLNKLVPKTYLEDARHRVRDSKPVLHSTAHCYNFLQSIRNVPDTSAALYRGVSRTDAAVLMYSATCRVSYKSSEIADTAVSMVYFALEAYCALQSCHCQVGLRQRSVSKQRNCRISAQTLETVVYSTVLTSFLHLQRPVRWAEAALCFRPVRPSVRACVRACWRRLVFRPVCCRLLVKHTYVR